MYILAAHLFSELDDIISILQMTKVDLVRRPQFLSSGVLIESQNFLIPWGLILLRFLCSLYVSDANKGNVG